MSGKMSGKVRLMVNIYPGSSGYGAATHRLFYVIEGSSSEKLICVEPEESGWITRALQEAYDRGVADGALTAKESAEHSQPSRHYMDYLPEIGVSSD